MGKEPQPVAWSPAEVRAWIDRHGGNVSACARELRVARSKLQAWATEDGTSARALPPYIQGACERVDEVAALRRELEECRGS